MAARIEDYALIGNTRAAGLVSREGSIDWLCVPRFDSASCFAALLGNPDNGRWLHAPAGPDSLRLRAGVEVHGKGLTTVANFTVSCGDRIPFLLTYFLSHEEAPIPIDPAAALEATERWWREWCGQCTYDGGWDEAVVGSLVVLKALTYEPTGGIVAAPTTSLPECLGQSRNWDYRFCWLRDATFTLYALLAAGYQHEAAAWREW